MADNSFIDELKQRRVIKAAAIYVAVAWGVTEITVTVVDQLLLPEWISTLAVIAFMVGFPIAMFLAWVFDLTPNGVRRTNPGSRRGKASVLVALTLLIASTAALFVIIKPGETSRRAVPGVANSIAVMPFENGSGNSEDDYLIAGLGDELREQLAQVTGFQLAARSSSIAARRQGLDAPQASEKLGVALLIEGNLRRRGNDVVVSVELVDGATGLIRWHAAFKRTEREIFSVQQSMVKQILGEISPQSVQEASTSPAGNSSATELMLLARYYELQVREEVNVDFALMTKAIDLYRQATEADAASALAFSRLARALMYANDFAGAQAPIFRAVTLGSELSEVQNTLGNYYLSTGVRGAGAAFRRAVELNRNNADALADYAWWLWMQSRANEAEVLYIKALELDPLSLSRYGALADFYGYTAQTAEALEIAARVERMFDTAAGDRLIGRIMELVGRLDASIAWTIRARDREPENPEHQTALAELYAEIGDFETATRISPETNVGLLFKMGRYDELIDAAEFLVIEQPDDLELQILLSFAYTLTERPGLSVRLLTLAGVADRALGETRHPKDVEGLIHLIDALDAVGEEALARQLAERWVARPHVDNDHWWVHVYVACPLAVLDQRDEALQRLERAGASARLPWNTLLSDMHCFQRFANEPRYLDVLSEVATRREYLLKKLPITLREFGVSL